MSCDPRPGEEQVRCPKCGSMHFHEAEFRQYNTNGDARNQIGVPVRVCLCGYAMPAVDLKGRHSLTVQERQSFRESHNGASQYRSRTDAAEVRNTLAPEFATKAELDDIREQISQLEKTLAQLRKGG